MPTSHNDPTLFDWGSKTYVMGILNITPDSFSGDGVLGFNSMLSASELMDKIREQARSFIENGADILDVGGESTRPGSKLVSQAEELDRVLPAIEMLASEFPSTVVSVDTYKAEVARQALDAGAHIVNDVWALRGDKDMATVVGQKKAWVILMHNRSKPENTQVALNLGGRYVGMDYQDLIKEITSDLQECVGLAVSAGIPHDKIILDPGIGFGKTVEQNLEIVNRFHEFKKLGYPLLLAPSRKSFIGYTLNLPPADRLEGTAAAIAIGIARGANMIRVHDVKQMSRVAKMSDAILRAGKDPE